MYHAATLFSSTSAPLSLRLLLGVEVDCSHRKTKVQLTCKITSVETDSTGWLLNHSYWSLLLKQNQYVSVDTNRWFWSYIWKNLLSCNTKEKLIKVILFIVSIYMEEESPFLATPKKN